MEPSWDLLSQQQGGNVSHISFRTTGSPGSSSFQWKVTRWPQIFPCSQDSVQDLGCSHSWTPRSSSLGKAQ